MPSGLEGGALSLAAADGVPSAPLVHRNGPRTIGRTDLDRSHERIEAQSVRRDFWKRPPQPREDNLRSLDVERERHLQDRFPALEASGIGLAQDLDVHQLVPDLHVVTVVRQQVEIVTVLDGGRRHGIEDHVRLRDGVGERAPLPTRDDVGHVPS